MALQKQPKTTGFACAVFAALFSKKK